jgi:hypothetical protein
MMMMMMMMMMDNSLGTGRETAIPLTFIVLFGLRPHPPLTFIIVLFGLCRHERLLNSLTAKYAQSIGKQSCSTTTSCTGLLIQTQRAS